MTKKEIKGTHRTRFEDYFSDQIIQAELPKPVKEYRFLPPRRFRFDFAWPEFQLGVEIDGGVFSNGRHVQGIGYTNDCEKFNLASIEGWRVLRVTTGQVHAGEAIYWLKEYFNKLKERFWSKVEKTDTCWNWVGMMHYKGYGEFVTCTCNKFGSKDKAHRVSYILNVNKIPEGMCVCHKCDNRACVRPDHLWVGTDLENNQDRVNRGRSANAKNGNHSKLQLSTETIAEIRTKYELGGITQASLAKEYGVSSRHISGIVRREVRNE